MKNAIEGFDPLNACKLGHDSAGSVDRLQPEADLQQGDCN